MAAKSASGTRSRQASTGSRLPLTRTGPSGSPADGSARIAQVAAPTTISPACATVISRAPVLTGSPMAAKLRRASVPTTPTIAAPVLIPSRNTGQSGCVTPTRRVTWRISRYRHGAGGVVRLVAGGIEQGQDAIAFEVLDRPAGAVDDRDHLGPVRVQHLDHLAGCWRSL